jgi:hypothetical protein
MSRLFQKVLLRKGELILGDSGEVWIKTRQRGALLLGSLELTLAENSFKVYNLRRNRAECMR